MLICWNRSAAQIDPGVFEFIVKALGFFPCIQGSRTGTAVVSFCLTPAKVTFLPDFSRCLRVTSTMAVTVLSADLSTRRSPHQYLDIKGDVGSFHQQHPGVDSNVGTIGYSFINNIDRH